MSVAGARAIGIDVGGTKTAALRVAADGAVLAIARQVWIVPRA